MTPEYSQEQFEAYPPPEELGPLQMVRRALVHSAQARHHAAEAARLARGNPADDRLAKAAAHQAAAADAADSLAAGAVLAYVGEAAGVVLVREGDRAWVRADAADPPRLRKAGPASGDEVPCPAVLDLCEQERSACRRSAEATIVPGPLLDRVLALIDRPEESTPLGYWMSTQSVGWYVSTVAWSAQMRLKFEAEEAARREAFEARGRAGGGETGPAGLAEGSPPIRR